ncbi:hypothetical protein IMCC9480_385 [Oxalobacteraceae bacterium IMCC9480]|nr:hypothetical protein IMCC9480_385 [Oxalobacteraceae bacterium IMCC9480]
MGRLCRSAAMTVKADCHLAVCGKDNHVRPEKSGMKSTG